MELSKSSFVLSCGNNIWKIPSKLNGYECTCHTHMRTIDACMYSSTTTLSLADIPETNEELLVFITKLKSENAVLRQAFSFIYSLYKLNQK